MLTYKRKLILTKEQQSRIDKWMGACRVVYNLGLEVRIAAWKSKQEGVHKYELMKQITGLRKDVDWINDVPIQTLQDAIKRLDKSYNSFFKGGGFPKWAKAKKYNSIGFKQDWNVLRVKNNIINIPKMGGLKIFKDAEIKGTIKTAVIKKEITGYFIYIVTDAKKSIRNQDENQVIGLDMGISVFATDSEGNSINNPKHFKTYERKLRIEGRSLARKKKGSNSWKKQALMLAKLHYKIGNVRRDFLHKESTKIAKQFNAVFLEDLNVSGMAKSSLAKHILDAGWAMFRKMLEYKTNTISVNPKFTSQTCSNCGEKDSNSRVSQSSFICTSCGFEINADVNAAKNILDKGIVFIRKREAIACA